jgi:hypothetical protein
MEQDAFGWEQTLFSQVLSAIFMGLYSVFGVIVLPWFYQRRDTSPIHQRKAILAFFGASCGILFGITSSMTTLASAFAPDHIPCFFTNLASGVFLGLFIDTLLVRSYLLFFAFNLVQEKISARIALLKKLKKKGRKKSRPTNREQEVEITTIHETVVERGEAGTEEIDPKALAEELAGHVFSEPINPHPGKSNTLTIVQLSSEPSEPLKESEAENHEYVSRNNEETCSNSNSFWFSKNKHVLSRAFEIFALIVLTAFHLIITFGVSFGIDMDKIGGTVNSCLSGKIPLATSGILSIQVILYVYFSFKLRVCEDAYEIKKELMQVGKTGLIVVFAWNLVRFVGPRFMPIGFAIPLALFVLYGGIFIMLSYSVIFPLLASYRFENDIIKVDAQGEVAAFIDLLMNKDGCEAFRKFLEKEFSVENIYFWEASLHFYDLFKPKDAGAVGTSVHSAVSLTEGTHATRNVAIVQEALKIYDTFLRPESKLEINISHKMLHKFRTGPLSVRPCFLFLT